MYIQPHTKTTGMCQRIQWTVRRGYNGTRLKKSRLQRLLRLRGCNYCTCRITKGHVDTCTLHFPWLGMDHTTCTLISKRVQRSRKGSYYSIYNLIATKGNWHNFRWRWRQVATILCTTEWLQQASHYPQVWTCVSATHPPTVRQAKPPLEQKHACITPSNVHAILKKTTEFSQQLALACTLWASSTVCIPRGYCKSAKWLGHYTNRKQGQVPATSHGSKQSTRKGPLPLSDCGFQ